MEKLLNYLSDLKTNFNAIGLKAEFETEGASFDDICLLKELSTKSELPLSVKIGGCGDIRSLIDTQRIKANTIVAPMIESPYALQKFVESYKQVYGNSEQKPNLYINIETLEAINNLNLIFESEYMRDIFGIVLGRGDLAQSLDITVDNKKIEDIIQLIITRTKSYGKKLIIGGKILPENIGHFNNTGISGIETRKIIFKPPVNKEGIIRAIEFEIKWLESKHSKNNLDIIRLEELHKRINDITKFIV